MVYNEITSTPYHATLLGPFQSCAAFWTTPVSSNSDERWKSSTSFPRTHSLCLPDLYYSPGVMLQSELDSPSKILITTQRDNCVNGFIMFHLWIYHHERCRKQGANYKRYPKHFPIKTTVHNFRKTPVKDEEQQFYRMNMDDVQRLNLGHSNTGSAAQALPRHPNWSSEDEGFLKHLDLLCGCWHLCQAFFPSQNPL